MGFNPGNPAIGTGGPPSGPAGGSLAGTYPNPTLKAGITVDLTGAAPTVAASHIGLGGTTQLTVGAAGAAAALPATPSGYVIINAGGTNFVVPYYAAV